MTILIIILNFFGVNVILSKNPIHSILNLVMCFITGTILLLVLGAEFIAMLFLVVYVGAIAVLFLFVIMMLNIKVVELNEKIVKYLPIALFIVLIFFFQVLYLISSDLLPSNFNWNSVFSIDSYFHLYFKFQYFDNFYIFLNFFFQNIEYISYLLFVKYIYSFLLAGMVLLVAMIGAIILTLNQSFKNQKQNLMDQINKQVVKSIQLIK